MPTKKKIPFVRGFRIPDEKRINEALGSDSTLSKEFCSSFDSLPRPTDENDWLANYKETGQTHQQFLDDSPALEDQSVGRSAIYLTVLDRNSHSELLDMDQLVDYTQRFFQMPVKLLTLFSTMKWNEKTHAWMCSIDSDTNHRVAKEIQFKTRYDSSSEHSQIDVVSVLKVLRKVVPADARCLVAISMEDFYSDSSDLFIAGLSHGNGRVAAFSFFRYDPRLRFSQEFWYDWKLSKTKPTKIKNTLLLRSCRLLTHEIGHLLGIDHCIYYACLMNGSGHLKEDFSQPLFLCPIDLRKLTNLSRFDLIDRYEQILKFCNDHSFTAESTLLQRRIRLLKVKDIHVVSDNKRKITSNESVQRKKLKLDKN